MRVLLLVGGRNPRVMTGADRIVAESGNALRTYVFPEVLGADVVNLLDVMESDFYLKFLYCFLPKPWTIAVAGFRKRHSFDAVVTWSEQISVAFSFLQWISLDKKPHVAMLYWMSKPLVRRALRCLGNKISGIVTWSSVQRRYAIEKIGIPEDRIFFVPHFVDDRFWKHQEGVEFENNLVAAVGSEMRDYDTFIEAMKGTHLHAFIATKEIRITKLGVKACISSPEEIASELPSNVVVRPLSAQDLRNLYDRAAVVVVPVLPNDTDNGVTVILEAMSMGKVVICSKIVGQVDVIENGVNGFYVEPQNPVALRELMEHLVANKALCEKIGQKARENVEKFHRIELFSHGVRCAVEKAVR